MRRSDNSSGATRPPGDDVGPDPAPRGPSGSAPAQGPRPGAAHPRAWLLLALLAGACTPQEPDAREDGDAPFAQEVRDETVAGGIPDEPDTGGIRDERDLAAIGAMLHAFSHAYVTGAYAEAAARYSDRVVAACGGGDGLRQALARTHGERGVDYAFYDEVVPWRDDPRRADVIVVERWDGNQADMPMGLEFAREDSAWVLDGFLLPEGLSAHCDSPPARP